MTTDPSATIQLSIIAPAHDEQDNIAPLLEKIQAALADYAGRFELIVIDDNSKDQTPQRLDDALANYDFLRVFRLDVPGSQRGLGPSAAFAAGFAVARGELICTIDADLQNDPLDIPQMIQLMHDNNLDLVQGDRTGRRKDNFIRLWSSKVGRIFRRMILNDPTPDTACALRIMKRDFAAQLPLHFKGMHRFIPHYCRMVGGRIDSMKVRHHPRVAGKAKFGIWNRALPGLIDLLAVRWMTRRYRAVHPQSVRTKSSTHAA